jgi:hypothetical protein
MPLCYVLLVVCASPCCVVLVICAFLLCFVGVHQHPLLCFIGHLCLLVVSYSSTPLIVFYWLYVPPCCALLVFISACLLRSIHFLALFNSKVFFLNFFIECFFFEVFFFFFLHFSL